MLIAVTVSSLPVLHRLLPYDVTVVCQWRISLHSMCLDTLNKGAGFSLAFTNEEKQNAAHVNRVVVLIIQGQCVCLGRNTLLAKLYHDYNN